MRNGMQGQTKKTWTEATVFWNKEVNLKCTCTVKAGQYGFGGNTTDTATTEADAAYEQLVHDFSSAFDKIQTTISGLTATNTQLQQQLQQAKIMCHAMNNCIPPSTYQMPFQPQQQIQSQYKNWKNSNRGGHKNGCGNNRAKEKETATAERRQRQKKLESRQCKQKLRRRTTTATMEASSHHRTIHRPRKHKSFQQ